MLLAGWGIAHAALALATGPASLGALLLLAGATIAPTLVYANSMLDALAPPGTLTEAFTWTTAGLTAGIAAGAALAGAIVEASSPILAVRRARRRRPARRGARPRRRAGAAARNRPGGDLAADDPATYT